MLQVGAMHTCLTFILPFADNARVLYAKRSFEIISTTKAINIQFLRDIDKEHIITTYINWIFARLRVILSYTYFENILKFNKTTMVVDFGLQHE